MRVISGSAKRLQLKSVEGFGTRPTTDRIKETLFNIIHNDIYGCCFLDLFSGSGAIGIEALSRGAAAAYFIENDRKAADCIRGNLELTKLWEDGILLPYDCMKALDMLEQKNITFDIIFMDPPYGKGLEREVLQYIGNSNLITEDTMIIVEAEIGDEFSDLENLGYCLIRRKEYKSNQHLFIKKQ